MSVASSGGDVPPERGRLQRAIGWSYVMDAGGQGINAAFSIVLAAIVGPSEFGIVALAVIYVLFIDMVQRQGMTAALVQRRDLQPLHLSTAFWSLIGLSVVLTALSVAASGWWAGVNDAPRLRGIVIALSLLLPIQSLTLVQDALLRRELRFRALALRTNAAALAGGVCGLLAAAAGWRAWALVVQQLVTAGVALVVLWSASSWRPSIQFSLSHGRELFAFSSGAFLSSIAAFVRTRTDALVTGVFFGPTAIGLYRFAGRLVDQAIALSLSGRSLLSVTLAELSRHEPGSPAFRRQLGKLLWVGSVSGLPLLAVLAAAAEPLTRVVGAEWADAAPALQLLCAAAAVRAMSDLLGPAMQAAGRPHLLAVVTWIVAATSAIVFVATGALLGDSSTRTQVVGMAFASGVVFSAVVVVLALALATRVLGMALHDIVVAVRPATVAATVAGLAGAVVSARLPTGSRGDAVLATLVVVSITSLLAGSILLALDSTARATARRARRALRDRRGRARRRSQVELGASSDQGGIG